MSEPAWDANFQKLAEAVDEVTVDAGPIGKNGIAVNRQAYTAMCQVLIDTGYWSQEELEARRKDAEEWY